MTLEKLTALTIIFSIVAASFLMVTAARQAQIESERVERHKQMLESQHLRSVCANAFPLKGDYYYQCIKNGMENE